MMRTERINLAAQVRMYINGELDASEQDLFFYDLDADPALRDEAWWEYTKQSEKAKENDARRQAA